MKSDDVGVTFVNAVLGRGMLNGIVNLQFGVLNFDAREDGTIDDR